MILVIAPYDGRLPEQSPFIAGAKKIRTIIKALKSIDQNVVLLNSGHQKSVNQSSIASTVTFEGVGPISIYSPETRKNSNIGRLLNICNAPSIMDAVVDKYGIPDVIWFYNGYAFEMRIAAYAKKKYRSRLLLEFEDWHFARERGLNPKPYLDWMFWRLALRHIDTAFAVNSRLAGILQKFNIPALLLPGIVDPLVSELPIKSPPFQSDKITIGYFGGLSIEKGADVVLRLAKITGENVNYVVTGSGPLKFEFECQNKINPSSFVFLGAVSEPDLVNAIARSDVILNAHVINDGVFPFKILEALASARLVISTALPIQGFESFLNAIQFYDGSDESLFSLINSEPLLYKKKKNCIAKASLEVINTYGFIELINKIRKNIGHIPH